MPLQRSTLALFSGPSLPVAALGTPLVVYLPPYYASELGLGLTAVGIIFFLVRAIDLPLDPLLGAWMDATRTRYGRFRPWLAAGALRVARSAYMVFFAERPGSAGYAVVWLGLLYAGLSMMLLSQTSWGALLTDDYDERSRVFGWWQAANMIGLLSVLLLPPLVGAGEGSDASRGIHAMGWFIVAMIPLLVVPALLRLPEPADAPVRHPSWRDFTEVMRNPLVQRLLVADLLVNLAPGVSGALFRYFFERVGGYSGGQTGVLLLVYFSVGLLAATLWTRIAYRFGKHRALAAAAIAYAFGQLLIFLIPPGNFALALAGMAVAGIPFVAGGFLLRAMLADVADADRLASGADRTGLLYAILTTTQKFSYALPIAFTYLALDAIGFDPAPGAVNTAFAVDALVFLFAAVPALFVLLLAWVAFGWPHDAAAHAKVRAALDARAAGAAD